MMALHNKGLEPTAKSIASIRQLGSLFCFVRAAHPRRSVAWLNLLRVGCGNEAVAASPRLHIVAAQGCLFVSLRATTQVGRLVAA